MLNAVLLSSNNAFSQPCTIILAQQLLRQGLAKIVKYYPLTVKFKGDNEDDGLYAMVTDGTKPPRMENVKLRNLEVRNTVNVSI